MTHDVLELRARQPKAIHSAFTVLEGVARCGAGVTAREVSHNLRMPRATTYRLLNLLVQEEYHGLFDPAGIAPGRKVSELVLYVAPVGPPQGVREVIEELRTRIRGGVHLVCYSAASLHVLDADPDYPFLDEQRLLREFPASAFGRLRLAEQSQDPQTRRLGFTRQIDSFAEDHGCFALPIRDPGGLLVTEERYRYRRKGIVVGERAGSSHTQHIPTTARHSNRTRRSRASAR